MAWTGAYDAVSFLAPIRRRNDEILKALKAPNLDNDAAAILLADLDELRRFVEAVKKVAGPCPELEPVTWANPRAGELYRLKVSDWRGYYLLSVEHQAWYGALVTHKDLPTAERLAELQVPARPSGGT